MFAPLKYTTKKFTNVTPVGVKARKWLAFAEFKSKQHREWHLGFIELNHRLTVISDKHKIAIVSSSN